MNTIAAHDFELDLTASCQERIRGVAGLAVRLGEALERWGHETARPLTRDEVQRIHTIRREVAADLQRSTLTGSRLV